MDVHPIWDATTGPGLYQHSSLPVKIAPAVCQVAACAAQVVELLRTPPQNQKYMSALSGLPDLHRLCQAAARAPLLDDIMSSTRSTPNAS